MVRTHRMRVSFLHFQCRSLLIARASYPHSSITSFATVFHHSPLVFPLIAPFVTQSSIDRFSANFVTSLRSWSKEQCLVQSRVYFGLGGWHKQERAFPFPWAMHALPLFPLLSRLSHSFLLSHLITSSHPLISFLLWLLPFNHKPALLLSLIYGKGLPWH